MKIIHYGHSCIGITLNGIHLLIEENGNILNGHFKGQNIDHIYKNKTINEKKVKQRNLQKAKLQICLHKKT